ncbi:septum formation inhibitor Maf [Pseudomonas sp. LTJR-52]|uniref:Maf family protein n=1 Tax=Pseudomonas sp. LTJR-52 TaxID=2479392 RepID=UPI000EFC7E93|nr:nucleoside triphosphate pyrophosphatase [Pseudomonas sp. LTJR-52]AYN95131.1 septum formation inhibitor Maf [Pseudomonas sp. LTJR-52]
MLPLLLASSSPYRRELLARLKLNFTYASPNIDESPHPGESACYLAMRLAEAKARALAPNYPNHLIIGSDQTASLDGQILGKSLTYERAHKQLSNASGKSVTFMTGLALLNTQTGTCQLDCVPFTVHFRTLESDQIERYLNIEQPYDCAGSFKVEGLGITLFRSTEGEDVTSLIGLPLIRLTDLLLNEGVAVP